MNFCSDMVSQLTGHLPIDWPVLAQNITDPDILGQMQRAFTHFLKTGQAWALLIGLAIGYMIRSLTSYG
ncbi:hypothetical protein QUB80_14000 [Chlorogloeopsis sp. ULAP01]|uniref:hypothetical protein n=1 Tax=Chlorogloeopsis sp. ULAP01 TaxID=3056483 RepID=UPI0025AAB4FA|nr:hypothetical protein [Chlorogloeopsis sp. ULAP01]MDM9381815.1 hypothetical protein [Chlorogloeopsis sp. ULAP01]